MAALYPFNSLLVCFRSFLGVWIICHACGAFSAIGNSDVKKITSSIELWAGAGTGSRSALAGVQSTRLVRIDDNGNGCDQYREGGSVKVSYAGVPLAYGSTSSFLEARKALAVAVNATGEGAGVPDDLLRLMSAERRLGVAWRSLRSTCGCWAGPPGSSTTGALIWMVPAL
uniref:Uncharacterized protein n=1 Tax=Oryza punctata TaxID=4537 RepID=A0A0E0JN63_ORYPU